MRSSSSASGAPGAERRLELAASALPVAAAQREHRAPGLERSQSRAARASVASASATSAAAAALRNLRGGRPPEHDDRAAG